MTKIREEFPALWQFLGAYLYQDWQDEYSSIEAAFRDFLDGDRSCAGQVAAELTAVLESGRDEAALDQFLRDAGSYYLPSLHGLRTRPWLTGLLETCTSTDVEPR